MQTYLDSPIKEVIDRYPQVGAILDEYGVGCVTCSVGTCPVKDIISIHNLPPADEQAVMSRIADVINAAGGAKVATSEGAAAVPAAATAPARGKAAGQPGAGPGDTDAGPSDTGAALSYSPPLRQLVEEHVLIKRWLALIPAVVARLDLESPADRRLVLDGVDFIRSYADKLHHAKEEDILFKYYDESRPVIKIMLADHEQARGHARAAEEGVHERDTEKVAHHLLAYRDLLTQHIRKEDEILYPWMDHDLTTAQVGELFARFAQVDSEMGNQVSTKSRQFVERAEKLVATDNEREAA
jgi:hemerythrin-like domain-containing protein